ncbi:hypothetical protein [Bacillus dakarensis]|uniref:hypothetical protein n=1 Tax=Robertmurraya dakarensis TaxID=1926278 RepID=UPI000981CF06|nr:hypothetical protein [Bacillus dakarensis]
MSKSVVFHSFEFQPCKLKELAGFLENKYKDEKKYSSQNLKEDMLPPLLDEIRKLSNEKKFIIDYANNLSSKNIRLLAFYYPYIHNEKADTKKKIHLILKERYQTFVGGIMWNHFQNTPTDPIIISILRLAFNMENDDFLSLDKEIRNTINIAINQKNLLHNLERYLSRQRKTLMDMFKIMSINPEGKLAKYLWYFSLKENLHKPSFLRKEGDLFILGKLHELTIKNYKQVFINYLSNVAVNEFNSLFLEQVLEKLKDPRKNDLDWKDMPPLCIEKVKQWLIRNELKKFFAEDTKYDRFRYWEKHTKNIKDVDFIENPMLAIMDFGEFVVVEFAETGNAAYFYRKEAFYNSMYIKVKYGNHSPNQIKQLLKSKDADYYINKEIHSPSKPEPPGWHTKFNGYMRAYMQGDFLYNHRSTS